MRSHPAPGETHEIAPDWRLETRDPDDAPIEPPNEDPDDPDLLPDEDDEYQLPGEEDEHTAPVEPHEEPLVAP